MSRNKPSRIKRVVVGSWACMSAVTSWVIYIDMKWMGMPDGYVAPYWRETRYTLYILAALCVGQAFWFSYLAIASKQPPKKLGALIIVASLIAFLFMLLIYGCPSSDFCQSAYQQLFNRPMDSGQGG